MPRPTLAVSALVRRGDGRVLVVRRGREPRAGLWTLPGGAVEPGEPVADAVAREVAEETALTVTVGGLVGWHEHLGDAHHYVVLTFAATPASPAGTPVAGDDAAEARWATRVELASLPTTEGLLELLDSA